MLEKANSRFREMAPHIVMNFYGQRRQKCRRVMKTQKRKRKQMEFLGAQNG